MSEHRLVLTVILTEHDDTPIVEPQTFAIELGIERDEAEEAHNFALGREE